MNENYDDYLINVSILSYGSQLEEAKKLMYLASHNENMEKTLFASSIILMAAILEQVTKTIIKRESERHAKTYNIPVEKTPQRIYLSKYLRDRVFAIPKLMSSGKYTLCKSNNHVKMLHEVIYLRNSLVHMEDLSIVEKFGEEKKLKKTVDHSRMDGRLSFSIEGIKVPENPWFSITKQEAHLCYEAVEKYLTEIIDVYWEDPADVDPNSIINSDMVVES